MKRRKEPEIKREKCDCDVNALLDEAREQWKKGWKFNYLPWNEFGGYLWCAKHHTYIRITHDAASVPASDTRVPGQPSEPERFPEGEDAAQYGG